MVYSTVNSLRRIALRSYERPGPQQCRVTLRHNGSRRSQKRFLQTDSSPSPIQTPDFAFAFDIDGVLLRSSKPLPLARQVLSYLHTNCIPFIFLTNGGGKHETQRVEQLQRQLQVPLHTDMFVQSHTPFAALVEGDGQQEGLRDKCVLVLGGDWDACRVVAETYGFRNVITPGDIITAHPSVWPFARVFTQYYHTFAKPLPQGIDAADPSKSLKIDAVFVFHDPRDWALDIQIVLDVLLSSQGILGTYSPKNNNPDLPNRGFQQDGQPPIYFSNPDLLWAAAYHLPRLGQGGFREALEGVWAAVTGGPKVGVELQKKVIGKPYYETYAFAEKKLELHRQSILGAKAADVPLRKVYMIGDNPESDIKGANDYKSPSGREWCSVLVRSGVFQDGTPAWKPKTIVDGVSDAVVWSLKDSGWDPSSDLQHPDYVHFQPSPDLDPPSGPTRRELARSPNLPDQSG